tara:strand:- start:46 stop:300 length:255 start_codon:yes stop_codon:yes gene_type:complete
MENKMKHKDYMKLMKTPFDKLSKQDKEKRKKEFHRRLEVAQVFISGMVKGYINNDIDKLMDDDDPLKETVKLIKLQINEVEGIS